MSINLNSAFVGGRLGRDVETKFTADGKCIAKFSLAVDDGWGDKKRTNWLSVTCFDKLAESVGQYCARGSEVVVEGRIQVRQYDDKDGNKRTAWDIIANRVHFGAKANGWQGGGNAAPAPDGEPADDDMPF